MLLKYYKASGVTSAPLQGKASRYVSLGYHLLLNYRESGGGFSYWGHGSPDAALTAYAVRFLSDISAFTDVDPEIIQGAEKWLVGQQAKDGHWQPRYGHDDSGLTAYIAVTLVESEKVTQDPLKKSLRESVSRALAYLSDPHRDLSEPYALAEFAITTSEFGEAILRASSAHNQRAGFGFRTAFSLLFFMVTVATVFSKDSRPGATRRMIFRLTRGIGNRSAGSSYRFMIICL